MNNSFARMARAVLVSCAVLMMAATATAEDLKGMWSGSIDTTAFYGNMDLKLAHEGEEWKAEIKISADEREVSNPVRDLKVNGDEFSFTTEIVGADVNFTGKLSAGKITGKLEAFQNGSSVGTGTYKLERQTGKK